MHASLLDKTGSHHAIFLRIVPYVRYNKMIQCLFKLGKGSKLYYTFSIEFEPQPRRCHIITNAQKVITPSTYVMKVWTTARN